MLLTINAERVRELLPMSACIDVLGDAMRAASTGAVRVPARTHMPLADDSAALLLMPGSSLAPPYYGAKIVSMHDDNAAHGLPAIQGVVVLFDHATGTPAAVIDAAPITAIRTAAASALATRELARADARTHGVFGTGVQAASHIEAIACVRDIDEVRVWGRDPRKTEQFAARQSDIHDTNIVATTASEAAACDIVTTATGSAVPVLKGRWLQPGSHLNLVGAHTATAREVDSDAIVASQVFVDLRASAMNEAGDILIPMREGAVDGDVIAAEIGEVLSGDAQGRTSPQDITLYKSLGIVAQDLFAAAYVLDAATTVR